MEINAISSVSTKTKQKNSFSDYYLPEYLTKHYWWAYLLPFGVKFFDQGYVVNRILWGNYHVIAQNAVELISKQSAQTVAGISCAYGEFFPSLVKRKQIDKLYLFDIAPIQIKQVKKKIPKDIIDKKCQFFLSDAENIALQSQSVDTAILFFLLHELPSSARKKVLAHTIRITKNGGRLVIADYAPFANKHLFHKNKIFSHVFKKMEPFLSEFWSCNLLAELNQEAKEQGRTMTLKTQSTYFDDFYRLLEFSIE